MKKDTKKKINLKKIERDNAIKEHFDCKVIIINPDEKDFDVYLKTGKIYNHINKSSKISLIEKVLRRLS